MKVWDGPLWRCNHSMWSDQNGTRSVQFEYVPVNKDSKALWGKNDKILLEGDFITLNSDFQHKEKVKLWQFYLFFICNPEAIDTADDSSNIDVYTACYHCTSPAFQFNKLDNRYQLEGINPNCHNLTCADENFCIKTIGGDDLEKIYILNLDYVIPCTNFWYYACTAEQQADKNFKANIFEKGQLPFPPTRFDFSVENRKNLISKFDSWILMS